MIAPRTTTSERRSRYFMPRRGARDYVELHSALITQLLVATADTSRAHPSDVHVPSILYL